MTLGYIQATSSAGSLGSTATLRFPLSQSASLLLFVPRPAPYVDHDRVAGTEKTERSLVIGSLPKNRAVCKGVKDAWAQGGFSLPTVPSRRHEGFRGRIMRALLNTCIKSQYSSKQRMKAGYGKSFSYIDFLRAGYPLRRIKTRVFPDNALEMNVLAYFHSVYIGVDVYTSSGNHPKSQTVMSATFALEEASSSGVTQWTNARPSRW